MKLLLYIYVVSLLLACANIDNTMKVISMNSYGKVSMVENEKTGLLDSVRYETSKGQVIIFSYKPFNRCYFSTHHDKLAYITKDHLFLLNPFTLSKDSISLESNFLNTSRVLVNGSYTIVFDYDKLVVLKPKEKSKIIRIDGDIYNATIDTVTKDLYYVVETSVAPQECVLVKHSLTNQERTSIFTFSGMMESKYDSTTDGWCGMLVFNKVIFLAFKDKLVAIDKELGKLIDRIEVGEVSLISSNLSEIKFENNQNQEIVFFFKKMKFKR